MEDLGHPSDPETFAKNDVHFMEFDDNDYASMPDAEPGSPSGSETSMVAFERELEEILSPGLQQQQTTAARMASRSGTVPAAPPAQPPSASSSVATTVRVETPSPDGVVRQIRTTPTPTPKKIPGEKGHFDPAWADRQVPKPGGVSDHESSRLVSGSANSQGCCQTPECCERCRKWQAETDQRLRSLEGAIEQTVTERVQEAMEGVWNFLVDEIAKLQKAPQAEVASQRSDSLSVSSLTGTDHPSKLSQRSLKRLSRELSSRDHSRGGHAGPSGPPSEDSDSDSSGSETQSRSTVSRKRETRPTPGTEERSRRSKSSRRSERSSVAFEAPTRPVPNHGSIPMGFEAEEEALGRTASKPLTINSVGAGAAGGYGAYYNTTTMAELRKRHPTPQFSGKVSDWGQFEEDWESYRSLYQIGLHPEVMIDLFKLTLPTGMQETIRLYRQQQPGITYEEVFQRFRKDYQLDNPYDARARWWDHRIQLPRSGHLDLTSFLNWKMRHEALRDKLADFSPHEEYSIIIRALPEHWKRKVAEFEKKLRRDHYWVRLSGISLTARQTRDLLEPHLPDDGRREPTLSEVRVLSNSIEVETRRLAHHEAILSLNGRRVTTKQGSFSLRAVEAKFRLTPERIFSFLRDELRSQESDSALKASVLQPGAPQSQKKVHAVEKGAKKSGADDRRSSQPTANKGGVGPGSSSSTASKGGVDDHRSSPAGAVAGTQVNRVGNGKQHQQSAQGQGKGSGGKEYPKPDPNLPYIPPPDYKGGCWWCYRRRLPDDHDYKSCKGRLAGRAGFEKIKEARARSRSQGPQGGH